MPCERWAGKPVLTLCFIVTADWVPLPRGSQRVEDVSCRVPNDGQKEEAGSAATQYGLKEGRDQGMRYGFG